MAVSRRKTRLAICVMLGLLTAVICVLAAERYYVYGLWKDLNYGPASSRPAIIRTLARWDPKAVVEWVLNFLTKDDKEGCHWLDRDGEEVCFQATPIMYELYLMCPDAAPAVERFLKRRELRDDLRSSLLTLTAAAESETSVEVIDTSD